jgi:hypothetical protein
MSNNPTGLHLKKPVAFYRKKLRLDFGSAFKTLLKLVLDTGLTKWDSVAKDVIDLGGAFNLASTVEEKAYLLIHVCLIRAMHKLTIKLCYEIEWRLNPDVWEVHKAKLDQWMDEETVVIYRSFFNQPIDLPILHQFETYLLCWLQEMDAPNPKYLTSRFREDFHENLFNEWKENGTKYQLILDHFDKNPFTHSFKQVNKSVEYQLDYDLNRADREGEMMSLLHHLQTTLTGPECTSLVFLVADREAEAEAFVDRWLAEQERYHLKTLSLAWEEKEGGLTRGIQPLKWGGLNPQVIRQVVERGIAQTRLNACYVALLKVPRKQLRPPMLPEFLNSLAEINQVMIGASCQSLLFVLLDPSSLPLHWQREVPNSLGSPLIIDSWSNLEKSDVLDWLGDKILTSYKEREYLKAWFPEGESHISMRDFRGHVKKFLLAQNAY